MKNEELVARALDGDRSAISGICTTYGPRVRAYFFHHGLASHQVDDALQDTWTRMFDAISEGRIRKRTFEGWLFTTARNVTVDLIRRAMRRAAHARGDLDTFAARPEEYPIEREERARAIERAIEELPALLRVPLILRHRDALSYEDIAKRLGISANAVGVRIYRARRILKEELQDHR